MTMNAKSAIQHAAKIFISAGLIFYLLSTADIDAIQDHIEGADATLLLLALLVLAPLAPVGAWRWYLICRKTGTQISLRFAVTTSYAGLLFGQVLPASVGSDAVRGWYAYRSGVTLTQVGGTLLIDKLYGLLSLTILIVLTGSHLLALAPPAMAHTILIVALAVIAGITVLSLTGRSQVNATPRSRFLKVLSAIATDSHRTLWSTSGLAILLVSIGMHGFAFASVMLIADSMGLDLGFLDCVTVLSTVLLLTYLPISLSGWGIREGAMLVGLGLVGIAPEQALAISILVGVGLLVIVLPGLPCWLALKESRRDAPTG